MNEKFLKDARILRFAKICCNAGLFCGIILLLFGLMPVFKVFYYVLIIAFSAVVLTFWLLSLLFMHPFNVSFLQTLFESDAVFNKLQAYALGFAPYFCAAAIALGVIAIVIVAKDKPVSKKGRIVAASLAIGFAVIGTVALYAGGML